MSLESQVRGQTKYRVFRGINIMFRLFGKLGTFHSKSLKMHYGNTCTKEIWMKFSYTNKLLSVLKVNTSKIRNHCPNICWNKLPIQWWKKEMEWTWSFPQLNSVVKSSLFWSHSLMKHSGVMRASLIKLFRHIYVCPPSKMRGHTALLLLVGRSVDLSVCRSVHQ